MWEPLGAWPLAERLHRGDLDLTMVARINPPRDDTIDVFLFRLGRKRLAQFAVSSFGQIVHQLQHSDHAAVLGSRVTAAHASQRHAQALPFELPAYRSLLCWDTRAEGGTGIQWLKAQILGIFTRRQA
ncbi:MAG: hypothetical protein H7Z19_11690 [Chitinophagaceae bacterium]|nr:hypothetical protein [Rubrivivax sp.]